tara:strand:- start:24216 stop:24560 length:345 start_codon:yes stop_codon:yes gene_type:complete
MTDSRGKGMKFDGGKVRPSLLPVESLEQICEVLEFGAQKYAANSWQSVEGGKERYFDALQRHLWAFQKGEVNDPETGLSHLAHAGCNILFLLYLHQNKHNMLDASNYPDDTEAA